MADMFLKLDSIQGETLDQHHHEAIEIVEFTRGLKNPASYVLTQQEAASNSKVDNVTVTKYFDKSSITLAQLCAMGQHLPEGRITCRKTPGMKNSQNSTTL
jgi:type VI secretion system secreted protein Hcp